MTEPSRLTRDSLERIPVEREIAWSRNSEQYVLLLQEMKALGREIDAALQPGLRYSTDLLDLAPAGTGVYVAMPNISDELGQDYEIQVERPHSDPVKEGNPGGKGPVLHDGDTIISGIAGLRVNW